MAKTISVYTVDVGPHMHAYGDLVGELLRTLLFSKAINKPRDECSLLYFGSTETQNMVHEEMADQGDDGEYMHIKVEQTVRPPDVQFLKSLMELPKGKGSSDFLDAITVAADSINRSVIARPELEKANVSKEIAIISNFHQMPKEEDSHDFLEALQNSLKSKGVLLHMISIDNAASERQATKMANQALIEDLIKGVKHKLTTVSTPAELLGAFKCKEYSNTAYYAGPFTIANKINIRVKIAKKAKRETLPSTSLYSERSKASDATHEILREAEYKDASDPDITITPEERVKAYKYGKQYVPVSPEDEAYLAYRPDRGIHLMGFCDKDRIAEHHHVKDPWVMVPEKGNEKSGLAMSALVRAMERKKQAAIILFVPRVSETGGANAATCVGYPLLGNDEQPDSLILNHLPFAEDLRVAKFASLDENPDLVPSFSQLEKMRSVVQALDLKTGEREALAADHTANPIIHRFFSFMASQAADGDQPLPEPHEDVLVQSIFNPQPSVVSKAQNDLQALSDHFKMKVQDPVAQHLESRTEDKSQEDIAFTLEGAAASSVDSVGTTDPVHDFETLVRDGKTDVAFQSLPQAVYSLVDNSLGNRSYEKAENAVKAMRTAAAEQQRAHAFNAFLEGLAERYKLDTGRSQYWQQLLTNGVTIIGTDDEVEDFLRRHREEDEMEYAAAPMEIKDEDEDEFAGMD